MFKYVKFTKVDTEFTVLEFRGTGEDVEVNYFDVDVVSLKSDDESKIDELIASQPSEIDCTEVTHEQFRDLVANSAQLNRIREIVKTEIAKKYDVADEIAMSKRAADDVKRVSYDGYVQECIAYGDSLKYEIGY